MKKPNGKIVCNENRPPMKKCANLQMCKCGNGMGKWNGKCTFISTFSLSHYHISQLPHYSFSDLAQALGKITNEVMCFFQPAVDPHHAVGLFIRVESFPGHPCAFGNNQRFMPAPAHCHTNVPQIFAELLDFAYGIQFQEKGNEP